jgi:hypothetical protein
MAGSKRWTTGSVELCECSEIAGSPQGSPPAADCVGCEAGRTTCSERETGREELCEFNGIITMSAERPSDGSGRSPPLTKPQRSIMPGSPMQRVNANRRIPVSHKFPPRDWTRDPHDGKRRVDSLDQWDCVGMQWDCRICTGYSFWD